MTENYRILLDFRAEERTYIVEADSEVDAREKFIAKLNENTRKELKIKDVKKIKPIEQSYKFNTTSVVEFLADYLEQIDCEEYEFDCYIKGKKYDKNSYNELKAFKEFIDSHYLTNLEIKTIGDEK